MLLANRLIIGLAVFSIWLSHAQASKPIIDFVGCRPITHRIIHLSLDKPLPWHISPVHGDRDIFKANDMVVALHPSQSPLLGRLRITTPHKRWTEFNWRNFQQVYRASTLMLTKVLYPRDPMMQPKNDDQLFNLMGYERKEGIVFEVCPRLSADQILIYQNYEGKDPSPGKPLSPADLAHSPQLDQQLIEQLLVDLRNASDLDVLKLYRLNGPFPEPQGCEVCHLAKKSSSIFFHDKVGGLSLALDPRAQASNPGRAFIETYKHYPSLSYLPSAAMEGLGQLVNTYLETLEQLEGPRPFVDIQALMNLKGEVTPHFHLHLIPNRGWQYYDFGHNKALDPEAMKSKLNQFKASFDREGRPPLAKPTIPHKHFILIRHGETDDNIAKVIQGQTDTLLNPNGLLQAMQLDRFLNGIEVADIFCSPLTRATHTAEILAKSIRYPWVYLHDGLMERSFGKSEGTPNAAGDLATVDHKDAEDKQIFQDRCVNALSDILNIPAYSCSGTPVIVTHGGVVKSISRYLGIHLGGKPQNAVPMLFIPPESQKDTWKVDYSLSQ